MRDGQHLAELDPPLVEGVDAPDDPLREDPVLVERDQLPEHRRGQLRREDRVGRAVAREDPVRHERRRDALGRDLLGWRAEGERLGLGEEVRHQQVVVLAQLPGRAVEPDQVAGHQPGPLVDELVEGVLAVGARLAPHDGARGGLDGAAVDVHRLAVALHVELLEVGREAPEALAVGQHRVGLRAQEVAVPDAERARAAPGRCARSGRSGSARPPRGSRRGTPGSARVRWRWPATGRWPSRPSSGRPPSPRSRASRSCRCRTPRPPRRWSRPPRSGAARGRRPALPRDRRAASRARFARWSASRAS